jgi:hypothetical protein
MTRKTLREYSSGMNWPQEVKEWGQAVFKAWYGWVAGSFLAVLAGAGQKLEWWSLSKTAYICLLIFGFVVSNFLAWKKEYKAKNEFLKPTFDL